MRTNMVVAMLALLLTACDDNISYYHFEHVSADGWYKNDTVTLAVPPQKAGRYHMVLCMRATPTYPYSSVTVRTETNITSSKRSSSQDLRCHIYNNVGKLGGKKGVSNTELRFPMADITMRDGDSLTIKIHHLMRREALPGITDIGLELTDAQGYDQRQYEGI